MKVITSNGTGTQKRSDLILPLKEDPELYRLDKTNSVSWELSSQPGVAGAATYKFQARVLQGDEDARQMVRWRLDVQKVCVGLHVSTYVTRKPIMEACMRTGPLASFRSAVHVCAKARYTEALDAAYVVDAGAGDTVASDAVKANGIDHYVLNQHLDVALGLVLTNLLPRKILARVKRHMRRDMRKPMDMKIRSYYQNILRVNNEELPNLPPYGAGQRLSQDELLDIVLFGTPRSWQNEMERQGFDPMDKQLHEVIDFMENLENTEDKPDLKPKAKSASSKKKKEDSSSDKKKQPTHFCKHHGPNWSHNTADCRTLNNSKEGRSTNKTWTRKAAESNALSKKELAALVAKSVTKTVKKQLAAADKKRKSDSDDEDGECYLVETLTKDLEGFNYDDMEKLSLEEDEVSC